MKYDTITVNFFLKLRYLQGEKTLLYVSNFGEGSYNVNILSDFDTTLPEPMTVKITSLDSNKYANAPLTTTSVNLSGGEAVILESN